MPEKPESRLKAHKTISTVSRLKQQTIKGQVTAKRRKHKTQNPTARTRRPVKTCQVCHSRTKIHRTGFCLLDVNTKGLLFKDREEVLVSLLAKTELWSVLYGAMCYSCVRSLRPSPVLHTCNVRLYLRFPADIQQSVLTDLLIPDDPVLTSEISWAAAVTSSQTQRDRAASVPSSSFYCLMAVGKQHNGALPPPTGVECRPVI